LLLPRDLLPLVSESRILRSRTTVGVTSTTSVSNGSIVTPSCLWRITFVLPTEISKPSRRIVSIEHRKVEQANG